MATDVAKLNVSELDMPAIKSNMIAFLKSQSEFANFDFAGSGMDVIMDMLSYNTYYNSYNNLLYIIYINIGILERLVLSQ